MKKEQIRLRILNKTSKTVTIKINGQPQTFSWEDFNKKLVVVDKVWAVPNKAEQEKYEKADELIGNIVVSVLLQRGNAEPLRKMVALAQIGKGIEELQTLLECSQMEAMQLVRNRLAIFNPYMSKPMFNHPTRNQHKKIGEQYEKCNHPNRKDGEYSGGAPVYTKQKPTLGDAFECLSKLKEDMDAA